MKLLNEQLWQQFAHYLTRPYMSNAKSTIAINEWFLDIYTRCKAGEPIRLDFIQAQNLVTGTIVQGFSLNDAFIISDNVAVLTLPTPPEKSDSLIKPTSDIKLTSDRYVGVWLYDYGNFYEELHQKTEKLLVSISDDSDDLHIRTPASEFEGIGFISDQITAGLAEAMLTVNVKSLLGKGEVRIAMEHPLASNWHYDISNGTRDLWNYVIIHPFLRTGPAFKLNDYQLETPNSMFTPSCTIAVPTYATSSHLTLQIFERWDLTYKGAKHCAQGHINGRGILIYSEFAKDRKWLPIRDMPSPWQISKCNLIESNL